jgi:LemA protein
MQQTAFAPHPPLASARGTLCPLPKSDISDFGHLMLTNSGKPEFVWARERSERRVRSGQVARTCLQIFVLGFCLSACGINNIPKYQEIARAKWLDLLYAYSLRDDATRALIDVVQSHGAAQERQALEELVKARTRAHQAQVDVATEVLTQRESFNEFVQTQKELTAALLRVLTSCERDGELKSDQGFVHAATQLKDSDNRIAAARREYDEVAEQYNKELRTLPGAFWGATLYHNNRPMQTFTTGKAGMS